MRVTTTRVAFAAPRERVFAALTEPDLVRAWQYGSVLETDWAPGSPIRFTSAWEGRTYEQWGTVVSFDAPRLVAYSLYAPRPDLEDGPAGRFTMTYELDESDGATLLTIRQDDPRPGAAAGSFEGDPADPVLLALRAVVEG